MSIPLTINGVTYDYPETGDLNWGAEATDFAQAVTTGMLQKSGGLFQLLAEVDFGSTYGIKSTYYKSRTSNVASAGQIRLANVDKIGFRNFANDGDLFLEINSSNQLVYDNGVVSAPIQSTVLTDGHLLVGNVSNVATDVAVSGDLSLINTGAFTIVNSAVSYAKFQDVDGLSVVGRSTNSSGVSAAITAGTDAFVLRRSGTSLDFGLLLNANIDASAGINYSKLESISGLSVIGNTTNASAVGSPIVASNDNEVLRRSGTSLSFGSLVNANIDASAAIARSKLASGTASQVLINDGSGVMSSEAQLAITRGGTNISTYTTGDTLYSSASNVLSKLSIGSSGQVLTVAAGVPSWATPTPPLDVVSISTNTTAASGKTYLVNSSSGVVQVTLPAAVLNGNVTVKDSGGAAFTNNITVVGTIDGVSNDIIDSGYAAVYYVSNGTAWFKL